MECMWVGEVFECRDIGEVLRKVLGVVCHGRRDVRCRTVFRRVAATEKSRTHAVVGSKHKSRRQKGKKVNLSESTDRAEDNREHFIDIRQRLCAAKGTVRSGTVVTTVSHKSNFQYAD